MSNTGRLHFPERGLEKRKACDHCHVRKIKCDALYPECSHCTLYSVRCTYTPHIRRQRNVVMREYKRRDTSMVSDTSQLYHEKARGIGREGHAVNIPVNVEPALPHALPPPANYLIMIDDYFANFNKVVPLFNERKFRIMLANSNRYPYKRDPIAWASTNVVLALSVQYRATFVLLPEPYRVETFVQNAQSAMGDLVSQAEDLRCIQVLLGLAILLQTNCNQQSSSVLVATAIKLAHRMRIHRKPSHVSMEDENTSERAGVFWILYILDREISIKAREPYLQRDCDIEIELPNAACHGDSTGVIFDHHDGSGFNIFQARAHLARVQSSIYDWTCSISAEYLSAEEKRRNEQCLGKALRDWQHSIPDAFRYDKTKNTLPKYMTRHLLLLHFEYFQSIFKAYRVYSDNSAWIRRLTEYSDRYSTMCKEPITCLSCYTMPGINIISTTDMDLLPGDWEYLVNQARVCITLFREVDRGDKPLQRATYCTYTTAMIIIITNNLTFTEHELHDDFETDNNLVSEALDFAGKVAARASNEELSRIHAAYIELNRRAVNSVALFFAGKLSTGSLQEHRLTS